MAHSQIAITSEHHIRQQLAAAGISGHMMCRSASHVAEWRASSIQDLTKLAGGIFGGATELMVRPA